MHHIEQVHLVLTIDLCVSGLWSRQVPLEGGEFNHDGTKLWQDVLISATVFDDYDVLAAKSCSEF